MGPSDSFATRFCINDSTPGIIIAAHPDDEVIGAGAQCASWQNISMIHITDGAPRNLADARAAGFSCRDDYASARRAELRAAVDLIHRTREAARRDSYLDISNTGIRQVPAIELFELGIVDQEASFCLVQIVNLLVEHFQRRRPGFVVTHSYEGGHPDHDSTAFAVHAACAFLRSSGEVAPPIIEMTSYHNQSGAMISGEFLAWPGREVVRFDLTPRQRELKQRLFGCFRTQRKVLELFKIEHECFRWAPNYDFTKAPHEGSVHYEQFPWGIDGQRWRMLAEAATAQLNELCTCLR